MPDMQTERIIRVDMWREGKWLDLWSVVHFLSGISIGFVFYFLSFGILASTLLVLLSLIAYELWEMVVQIEEAPTNRFMDVVVGMIGFVFIFFILAPRLSDSAFILWFGLLLTANVVTSILGWHASQKAAELKKRVHARLLIQRKKLLKRKMQLRNKFQRSPEDAPLILRPDASHVHPDTRDENEAETPRDGEPIRHTEK
ncbi:MAG: hypothetical protein WCS97_03230 [Candidatus Paceibacterota bacterium]|jgi:hypothetical protein